MQHGGSQTPQKRARSKTSTSYPNFLKVGRSDLAPATSSSSSSTNGDIPSNLSLENLLEALTPPAVPSLAHARALVRIFQIETPRLESLIPVISRLCAPRIPSSFLASGIEIIAAYATSHTHPLTDIERASLFAVLRASDPDWTTDTWEPRLTCLSKLTKNGTVVTGFEDAFLDYTTACVSSAFQGLLSDDDSDRIPREKFLESVSRIMRETLTHNAAVYTDQNTRIFAFFEGFVQRSLDSVPAGLMSETSSIPSSPSISTHRRHVSSASGHIFHSSNRSPLSREPLPALSRTVLPISLYLSFLDMYRTQLTPANMESVVTLLVRIIAVHLSPLPHLSAWPTPLHRPHPAEESALNQLFALFASPYAETAAGYTKRLMSSSHPQEALGAFRAVRAVLRDGAESRMALRRQKYDTYESAPSGQLVMSDASFKILYRAHKEGIEVPSLTVDRLVSTVGNAVHQWAVRSDADKTLEEALGIVKDVMAEASDRAEEKDDVEDYSAIGVAEGRIVGTILSEAVKYVQRMRLGKTSPLPIDRSLALKIPFLPIDKPAIAPTPLLLTLCTQLALPLSTPMTPSLPSILLSITSHLTDAQTATIPQTMYSLGLLTPTSLSWLDNISELFTELVSRERPVTAREVSRIAETIHADLMGVASYRRALGRRVCELTERLGEKEDQYDGSAIVCGESLARLCTNELVCRVLESADGEESGLEDENEDIVERIISIFVRHVEGPCRCANADAEESGVASHGSSSQETTVPSTPVISLASSHSDSPVMSRVASESPAPQDRDVQPPTNSVLHPVMSILPSWPMGRTREPEVQSSPVTIRSDQESVAREVCQPLCAALALVNVFQELSFGASPQPAHSVHLFNIILSVLKKAKCPRARLGMLQLLMRLRADRDHRLYILSNVDQDVNTLAALVDRSRWTSREAVPLDEGEQQQLRRVRSTSRGLRQGRARSSTGSRSRSRPAPPPPAFPVRAPTPTKTREQLWAVPELLLFDVPVSEPSSEGITTYEANAPTEWEDLKHWLPVSDYVHVIVDILRHEADWEVLSYVLCHLPIQLANKHFFCGPKTKNAIIALLVTLCTATSKGEMANVGAEQMPDGLRLGDAQGLVFHTLAVLVSYRGIFDDRRHNDMLVEAFLAGLKYQPSTVKFCLNALSICAYELPSSMTKNLPHIIDNLSRIMTNAEMAVHILDFVSIVGSLPSLYSNFREQEFKMVFAVAVTYIHYHNSPDTGGLSGRESFALSQHVLVVAYYIIYVWFLAVALPDRPNHVQFLVRRLLLANEAKGAVDEPTEVCFDWLARYAYATADPKPAYSLLGDIVMQPPRNERDEPVETPLNSKVWLCGNSLITISTLPKRGWIEVESVRPSGETRFLCKLENFPQVTLGDVDPDMFTDSAIMMADRDPAQMERVVPDPELDQGGPTTSEGPAQDVRDIFVASAGQHDEPEERPDPVSGYVWSRSAPSQRRKDVTMDPSFFALQLSHYPYISKQNTPSQLVPPSPQLDGLLRTLKRTPVIDMHKIAILYVAPGQKEEREILGNRHGSPAYTRFLEGIGRLIRVRDQRDVYTGDIVPETDGEYAYAWWDDIVQVVYHTATLMPNVMVDSNFIYKKRHVGNDKVRIVWNDSGLPYEHNAIPSAFNFVNLVIEPHSIGTIAAFSNNKHEHEFFKVTMQRMEGMPTFGPIGDYKLVSAENLGPLMRQVSLLADFFCEVYVATDKDTSTDEYVTNWRRRLQYIDIFRSRLQTQSLSEAVEEAQGITESRDFTRFF